MERAEVDSSQSGIFKDVLLFSLCEVTFSLNFYLDIKYLMNLKLVKGYKFV